MLSLRFERWTVARTIVGAGALVFCIVCLSLLTTMAQQTVPPRGTPFERDPALLKNLLATAHRMLKQKEIPFDPNSVVEAGWQQRIDPALLDLLEIKKNLRVSEPLKGVYVANILMVGEDVRLKGDTVLLIKELAPDDENRDLKISGQGDLFMFIIGTGKEIRTRGEARDLISIVGKNEVRARGNARGVITVHTEGRCFVVGFPQSYLVRVSCRGGFVRP